MQIKDMRRYSNLSFKQKIQELKESGIYLARRTFKSYRIELFYYSGFFVELWANPDNAGQAFLFKDLKPLKMYWKPVDISEVEGILSGK